jgi:signal transduction histidine kinase
MSDHLHQKIAQLEKRLEREKRARKEAESLLEQKSHEIFQSNGKLRSRIEESEQKQAQLEFLTSLSADTWHSKTVDELIKRFVSRCSDFLNHSKSLYLPLDVSNPNDIRPKLASVEACPLRHKIEQIDLTQLYQLIIDANNESQLIELSSISKVKPMTGYCFIVPVLTLKKTLGLSCFFYEEDSSLNVFKLQTVESARISLNVAIKQKFTALKLQQKYKQLRSTFEQLGQTQKQLVHSEKMASLGQLAAGVAHEINNPIGFVLSNYQTLAEYLEVMDKLLSHNANLIKNREHDAELLALSQLWKNEDIDFIRDDLNELLTASKTGLNRVQDIVAGLKSFSHTDSRDFQPLNLNDCIDEAAQLVWNQLKYDCVLEKDFTEIPLINGRSGQLQQVFINMLVNAKQAMAEGGTIYLRTRRLSDAVVVEIEDSGSGIADEDLKQLFTPFFTTKPVGVGTGLGLSVSYGILQEHHATIDVKSEVGKGTCFSMTFPIAKKQAA